MNELTENIDLKVLMSGSFCFLFPLKVLQLLPSSLLYEMKKTSFYVSIVIKFHLDLYCHAQSAQDGKHVCQTFNIRITKSCRYQTIQSLIIAFKSHFTRLRSWLVIEIKDITNQFGDRSSILEFWKDLLQEKIILTRNKNHSYPLASVVILSLYH